MSDSAPQPRIQVCRSSALARRPALLQRLRQAGAAVEMVGCLDQCTLCHHRAVALVSGWYVYGRTVEELCDRIHEALPQAGEPGAHRAPAAGRLS